MALGERQLRIIGVLENVSVACDFVVEQARKAGLDDRAIHHCYLAVDEACTNIIEHGYGAHCGDCLIDVFCHWDSNALTVTITDDSPAFDPLMRPDPDPGAPLIERGEGGWGIFFIKKLMDAVSYSYEDSRNRLVMVKKIPAPQTMPAREPPARPIVVQPLSERIWMITLSGRLDGAQASPLETALLGQLDAGHKGLVLNLANVDYISSAGLKMMVSLWQRVRDHKGDLVLAAPTTRVHEVLEMIGLDLVFTITDTPDQARAYFASKVK